MKTILIFCAFLACNAFTARAMSLKPDTVFSQDSILGIKNLNSNLDTARIKEIISIKLKTDKPVTAFSTLFIDGLPVGDTKPWKISEYTKTIFFKLNDSTEQLVRQFLKNQSEGKSIVPVYLSVGNATFQTARSADPLYLEINQKINPIMVWVLAALLLILIAIALSSNILKDDNNLYYSLGRTQLFYWTILFSVCYLYVCYSTGMLPDIPASILAILGISAGTTAVTKLIDNNHKDGTIIHKDAKSEGWFMDILSDGTSINVNRFQNVVFNLLFGLVFIQRAFSMHVIPGFDTNVLVLLGISSGTYAGLKLTEAKKDQTHNLPETVSDSDSPGTTTTEDTSATAVPAS